MSSRRKANRSVKITRRQEDAAAAVPGCRCAVCDGGISSLRQAFEPGLADLSAIEDADELEVACSTLFGVMRLGAGDEALHGWSQVVLPMLRQRGTAQAAAVICAIGVLGGGQIEQAVEAQLGLLAADGIRHPAWVQVLRSPVTPADLGAHEDSDGMTWLLAGRLTRAGTEVGLVMAIDPEDCGALEDVWLVEGDAFAGVLTRLRSLGRRTGVSLAEAVLDAGEWRWRAETAMDARDVHDSDEAEGMSDAFDVLSNTDGDGPGWRAVATLLRFWIGQLPDSGKPKPPHSFEDNAASDLFRKPFPARAFPRTTAASALTPFPPERSAPTRLPSWRKKSDGPAPVYRLRVDLRGARPPIWRRLEIAGDTTLAQLHRILQSAFGWESYHMHCFETRFGTFGIADPDLGPRSDQSATLEQVLGEGGTMTYTYDFGDDWEHIIAVESIAVPAEGVTYPRCTGGRRATPPEDCGGIWGYAALCEILADPEHDEHEERLEWLGLSNARDFDPAAFNLTGTDRMLRT